MAFFTTLIAQTSDSRQDLIDTPVVQACLRGKVSPESYRALLQETYYLMRRTAAILRACRDDLNDRPAWLITALDGYIGDQQAGEDRILNDFIALGGDAHALRLGAPRAPTTILVACACDMVAQHRPMGVFGLVHVLETASVALALAATDRIQQCLQWPDHAFTYLRSFGTADRDRIAQCAMLMDEIVSASDQQVIIESARMFYRLYGDVLRGLPAGHPAAAAAHPDCAPAPLWPSARDQINALRSGVIGTAVSSLAPILMLPSGRS